MPSITKLPGTVAQGAGTVSWVNPNNALVEDGNQAFAAVGPGGGGGTAKQLLVTNYGFNLPSTAIIDGIFLEIKTQNDRTSTSDVYLIGAGGISTAHSTVSDPPWTATMTWQPYGGATDKWGRNWTPAEINNSAFGASMSAFPPTGVWNIGVDAVRITVYYHIGGSTTPADVATREIFKVRNQRGEFIGLMPKPVEALKIAQDINSLGSQITLKIPANIDTADSPTTPYTTEDGSANYTDEAATGDYVTEGELPIVSAAFQGIDTLIKNGNTVEAWIFNYFYPNGKRMFIGKIRRWEADDEGNAVDVTLYSSSYDLDNYFARGAPFTYTPDVSQTTVNAYDTISMGGAKGGGWYLYGQTWKAGVGVTNLGAITIRINAVANITINVYNGVNGALLGTTTQAVNTVGDTNVQFAFPSLITLVPGNTYFFTVSPGEGQSAYIIYQNTNVYADGSGYTSSYGGGSAGGAWTPFAGDIYFVTGTGTASTTAVFTAKDPSTQMLAPIVTDYNLRGGLIQWTATTIDATGLSLNYSFSVQTVYQALQAILDMSPAGFYYYIDIGSQTIYFKNASTTADFLLQKGVHINSFKLGATTEQSINTLPFTGGEVTPGVNLYKLYTNAQSLAAFGALLTPKSDNRVKADATADAIGNSILAEFAGEKYFTTVKLVATTKLDLTLLTPGKTIGFRGFGTFKDQIIAQIVRREWSQAEAVLTLGVLPTRLNSEVADLIRQVQQEQTQYNPSTPS